MKEFHIWHRPATVIVKHVYALPELCMFFLLETNP